MTSTWRRTGWWTLCVSATALILSGGLSAGCSKSDRRKKTSDGDSAEAKGAEEPAPSANGAAAANAASPPAPEANRARQLEGEDLAAARAKRAELAAARRSEARAEEELPPVLTVEQHLERVQREIDEKNYREVLAEIESEVKALEARGQRAADPASAVIGTGDSK